MAETTFLSSQKEEVNSSSPDLKERQAAAQAVRSVMGGEGSKAASMSKEEMEQIIASQRREIDYLTQKVQSFERERDSMVDNFKLSSGVLLERIKDLEAQTDVITHERPQTASVLSRIQAESQGRRIGGYMGIEARDKEELDEMGSTVRRQAAEKKVLGREKQFFAKQKAEMLNNEDDDMHDDIECPNCKEMIPEDQTVAHTVQCYRNSTKCRICGEVILKSKKQEHLTKWRDTDGLIMALKNDNEKETSLFFDHGIDPDMIFKKKEMKNRTPMHIAAAAGSLNVLLALISRGGSVDIKDSEEQTPLFLACEFNQYPCVRSLIELGAELEATDKFGRTPLMLSCKLGSKPTVDLLLKYKADIHATNNLGDSPMSFAQMSGNAEVTMALVQAGASLRPSSRALSRPPSGNVRRQSAKKQMNPEKIQNKI